MKKLRLEKPNLKTKRGVASLYVVIFATILFGVITVSFTRIILSEAIQSSNDDLSQSAYDSAIAGIEDAKVAVNNYYECVQKEGSSSQKCAQMNVFEEDDDVDCSQGFPLARALYGQNFTGEVKIQESGQAGTDTFVDQAYTCVVISDITPDYRGTLTSDTRTRVVPLAVNGSNINSDAISQATKIKFSWYSELNQGSNPGNFNFATYNSDNETWYLPSGTNKTLPPTMQVTLIKTSQNMTLSDFWKPNNKDNTVLDSSMLLLPADGSGPIMEVISSDTIKNAGNSTDSYKAEAHKPIGVKCESGQEFVCNIALEIKGLNIGATDNVFLVVNMPYGDAFTDFKVELAKEDSNGVESKINFQGSQISVDSTGRTNQLYRRVEARLDAADIYFPYPEFELSSTDGGSANVEKNSWVTSNCWHSWYSQEGWTNDTCHNNGKMSSD